jgi:hypothetical protein
VVPPPELLLQAAKHNKAQATIVDFGEKTSCRYVMGFLRDLLASARSARINSQKVSLTGGADATKA